jgi:hypothetical protein
MPAGSPQVTSRGARCGASRPGHAVSGTRRRPRPAGGAATARSPRRPCSRAAAANTRWRRSSSLCRTAGAPQQLHDVPAELRAEGLADLVPSSSSFSCARTPARRCRDLVQPRSPPSSPSPGPPTSRLSERAKSSPARMRSRMSAGAGAPSRRPAARSASAGCAARGSARRSSARVVATRTSSSLHEVEAGGRAHRLADVAGLQPATTVGDERAAARCPCASRACRARAPSGLRVRDASWPKSSPPRARSLDVLARFFRPRRAGRRWRIRAATSRMCETSYSAFRSSCAASRSSELVELARRDVDAPSTSRCRSSDSVISRRMSRGSRVVDAPGRRARRQLREGMLLRCATSRSALFSARRRRAARAASRAAAGSPAARAARDLLAQHVDSGGSWVPCSRRRADQRDLLHPPRSAARRPRSRRPRSGRAVARSRDRSRTWASSTAGRAASASAAASEFREREGFHGEPVRGGICAGPPAAAEYPRMDRSRKASRDSDIRQAVEFQLDGHPVSCSRCGR